MEKGLHLRALVSLLLAAGPAWPQSPPASAKVSAAKIDAKQDAKLARQAFDKGQAAERKGDLPEALDAYGEAVLEAPASTEYHNRLESVRFALIQQHAERAERDAVAGHSVAAREELRAAIALDPGYRPAQERLQQLERQSLHEADGVPAFATAPATLQPAAGTRTIDYRGEVRGAYEEVARQFGLTVVFDEDTRTPSLRFPIGEVDFATAMRVLGLQTKTFWRAIDAHTFFVANDTPAKRKEFLPFIERTIVLPESDRAEQMNEMLRLVREFSGLTHAQLDSSTRTLTLRGSQPDVALATELVQELEQARGEIMLEVEILEVTRDAAQKLGVTPPSSARALSLSAQQIRDAQQSTENLVQLLQQLFGTSSSLAGSTPAQIASLLGTGGVGLSSLVPPLIAFGGGKTFFLATLPGASADFAETLSSLRSARRVLLRAKDGEPATFFVGDRFPLSLAVLSSGSGFGGSGLVPGVRIENFTTGAGPEAVVTAAFRVSGHLDLATANADQHANTVSILLGNGDGTFGTNTDITVGSTPVALVAAQFGNGNTGGTQQFMDLAVANQGSDSVSVLLGNGDGTFQSTVANYPVGSQPSAIVAGHFTAGGNIDLAVANRGSSSVAGSSTISILPGNGDGTFGAAITIPLISGAEGPVGLATADFDNDGHADLVTANSRTGNVTVLFDDGHGVISPTTPQTSIAVGTNPLALTVADFNSDNHSDLAVANQGSDTITVLLGNATANTPAALQAQPFSTMNTLTLTSGSQPSAIIAADFNNDNHTDLAVAETGSGAAIVLFGNNDGTFPTNVEFPTGSQPSALASGDFNGDSLADLAIANANAASVTVVINSANAVPNQAPQQPYPAVQYEDIGLKVKTTPRLHPGNEVTLHMEMELRSLSTSKFNDIPVISNRSVDETMRLKMNEPSVLAGIFVLDKSNSVTGIPGVANLPGAGFAAGSRNPQSQDTELIIVVTPRLLRAAPRLDRARFVGPGGEPAGAAAEPSEPGPTPPSR
jgi:type II secretory pathway component GspD/PulD (secretin)